MKFKILKNLKYTGKIYPAGQEVDFPKNEVVKGLVSDGVLEAIKEPEATEEPKVKTEEPEKPKKVSKRK
jgi:hypothetical protein